MAASAWTRTQVQVGGVALRLDRAGGGPPLLVLHRDTGRTPPQRFHDALAERFDVLMPQHPGYGEGERPTWMRSVRDLAVLYRWLLADLGVARPTLLGLGFGGWVAAEMATMAPADLEHLVLVGPMGLKPPEGDILDQALLSHTDYALAGFHSRDAFTAVYGEWPDTDQLVEWDLCREMNFRIAWKPYMYSMTLPHLLGGVKAPVLIVHGQEDRVVPPSAAKVYGNLLPQRWLELVDECGHCVELERPDEMLRLLDTFCSTAPPAR